MLFCTPSWYIYSHHFSFAITSAWNNCEWLNASWYVIGLILIGKIFTNLYFCVEFFSGYSISLIFTELLECVEVLVKDSNLIQEVCGLETNVELNRKSYVKIKSRTANNTFKLKYSLVPTKGTLCFVCTVHVLFSQNKCYLSWNRRL